MVDGTIKHFPGQANVIAAVGVDVNVFVDVEVDVVVIVAATIRTPLR